MEQRAFSRIRTYLRGRLRILSSPDEVQLFSGFGVPSSPASAKELENSHIPEALVSFLLDLDTKVNAILSHLMQDKFQEDFPLTTEILELSGAGVRLKATEHLHVGQHIELVLYLKEFPTKVVGAIGSIVRKDNANGSPTLAVEFERMREDDLETIVQHVFNEERRQLRASRLEHD